MKLRQRVLRRDGTNWLVRKRIANELQVGKRRFLNDGEGLVKVRCKSFACNGA